MTQFAKHVFVCTHGPYCWFDGDVDTLFARLKRRVAEAGLRDVVRINRSGCLNQCGHGPMVVVYPEGVWYCAVQAEDADELFAEHLSQDRPVARLRYQLPPGNHKQTSRYPESVQQMKKVEKDLDAQRRKARLSVQESLNKPSK